MLQKYFPVLEEINSPFAALVALNFTAPAAKVAVIGISNETLENLLKEAVSSTATYKKEVETSTSILETARKSAAKVLKGLRYRAACAARNARKVAKGSRQVKAVRRPLVRNSHKTLKGLSIEVCRQRAVSAQAAVHTAVNNYNSALEAVAQAIEGGDVRAIRSNIAALKAVVSLLEVRHLEFKFAREMLSISLARHSA